MTGAGTTWKYGVVKMSEVLTGASTPSSPTSIATLWCGDEVVGQEAGAGHDGQHHERTEEAHDALSSVWLEPGPVSDAPAASARAR